MYNKIINIINKCIKQFRVKEYKDDRRLYRVVDKDYDEYNLETIYKIQRWTKEGWHTYHCFQDKGYLHRLIYISEYYLFVNPREIIRIIDYVTGRVIYE